MNYSRMRQLGLLMTVPFILLAGPVIGICLGLWLDKKMHSTPWGVVVLSLLGFAASGREVYFILRDISKE